eukprot:gene10392-13958_t
MSEANQPITILFLFFGLMVGLLVMQFMSIFGEALPYTVLVFLVGVIFATVSLDGRADTFSQSVTDWSNIDAELMLYVFLPPLIFGEAMSLKWHYVKGAFKPSLLLAGPGVLIGAGLMGVISKFILPYDWTWKQAMVFGSILSATDPALLKSAGASPNLTMVIVGESLMNDGTAMVLFTLFFNMLNGQVYDAGGIIAFFIKAAFGSVFLGVVFGFATVRWLRSANRPLKETDITIQVAITICCAYLVFFLAQFTLEISGVLACCGAGVIIAWLGPPIILSHEVMHNIWNMIEWVMNTLIFLVAGLIIGKRTLGHVNRIDWLYLGLLYIILMIIRMFVIGICYPWLSTENHKCTLQECIFMSWAGLRGALGMALALLVEKNTPDSMDVETSRIFFFVGGIAALTLIINATTAKKLLVWLDLLGNDSIEKTLVINQIKKKLRKRINKVIDQMSTDFNDEDLMEVRQSCTLLRDATTESVVRDSETQDPNSISNIIERSIAVLALGRNDPDSPRPTSFHRSVSHASQSRGERSSYSLLSNSLKLSITGGDDGNNSSRIREISRLLSMSTRGTNPLINSTLLSYVRAIFLEIVRVKYWHNIEGGKLPRLSHSAQFLLYSVDVGLDSVKEEYGAQDWLCIEKELDYKSMAIEFLSFIDTNIPICPCYWTSQTLGKLEARRDKRAVYILTSFIDSHEHAQKKIHGFLTVDDDELLHVPTEHNANELYQTPEEKKVITESRQAVMRAKQRLENMPAQSVSAIRSKQAARIVLAKEADMVKNMVQEGLLTNSHAEEFLDEIRHDTDQIERKRNKMHRLEAEENAQRRMNIKKNERASFMERGSSFMTRSTGQSGMRDSFTPLLTAANQPYKNSSVGVVNNHNNGDIIEDDGHDYHEDEEMKGSVDNDE